MVRVRRVIRLSDLVARGAVEVAEPEPVRELGMVDTSFGRPRWLPEGVHDGHGEDGRVRWKRTDPWETGFVDITGGDDRPRTPATPPPSAPPTVALNPAHPPMSARNPTVAA